MQVQASPLEPNSLIYKIKLRMDWESVTLCDSTNVLLSVAISGRVLHPSYKRKSSRNAWRVAIIKAQKNYGVQRKCSDRELKIRKMTESINRKE